MSVGTIPGGDVSGGVSTLLQRHADLTASVAIALCGLLLYARHLDVSPIYLAPDEVTIALTAHSLATTGTDLAGRSYPLYIQMTAGSWFHPLVVYLLALELKVVRLSEVTIRLPTAGVGVATLVLMYFAAKALFRSRSWAAAASMLLALTPAYFLHSRFALEYVYPLPFVMGWLLGLFTYLDSDNPKALFAATFALGLGFFSYIASIFVMPLFLLITGVALLVGHKPARAHAIAIGGFLVPIVVIFVPWLIAHPRAYSDTVRQYLLYDSRHLNPLQGIREFFSRANLIDRTSLYWSYFNPAFLFIDAAAPFMFSTRTTGVFLLPVAVLLPVGVYAAAVRRDPKDVVLLLGFAAAPAAAVLVKEPGSINRALEVVLFGVLLAGLGAVHLWNAARFAPYRIVCLIVAAVGLAIGIGYGSLTLVTHGRLSATTPALVLGSLLAGLVGVVSERLAFRIVTAALLAGAVAHFRYFHADYFTDYRPRASEAFHGNTRDALEYIIEHDRPENVPSIFLSGDIDGIRRYWRLYLIKHGREDLLERTVVFGSARHLEDQTIPPRSLVMARVGEPATERLVKAGTLTLERMAAEPGGKPAFAVYRR